jgi:uncharacterized membrane protein YidH (DUF202 family)
VNFEPGFSGVKERFIMNKSTALRVVAGGLALASVSSFAVIDVAAATTGISDAQTAVLAVLAAMITMAAAIYGVKKVLRLLGR